MEVTKIARFKAWCRIFLKPLE